MTTLIRQRSRGFWAALAIGIVTGAVLNGMFRPQFALADADTNNGEKFAQLTTQVEQLTAQVEQLRSDFTDTQVDLAGTKDSLTKSQTELSVALATIESLSEAQQQTDEVLVAVAGTLQYVSVQEGDINGLAGPHLIFEGCNVHVRSGSGDTRDGGELTGLGNLIVGYNAFTRPRTGSHNLVIGDLHSYTSFGGFVAGHDNSILGAASCVLGGQRNIAEIQQSSIVGGSGNHTMGPLSSILGGSHNETYGKFATVSGGLGNSANHDGATVGGGHNNEANGELSTVSGGNTNKADAIFSTVSGGFGVSAPDDYSWAAGGLYEGP